MGKLPLGNGRYAIVGVVAVILLALLCNHMVYGPELNREWDPSLQETPLSTSAQKIPIFQSVPPPASENSTRHIEEKVQLLTRLQKSSGTYDVHHPRHRLLTALHGFYRYKQRSDDELKRVRDLYGKVTKRQKQVIESTINHSASISQSEALIRANDKVAQEIVDHALSFYDIPFAELTQFIKDAEAQKPGSADRTSVSQALKHFVRDWAAEGAHERDATFPAILSTLAGQFPNRSADAPVRVLVPGAGLGRLAHEISALGGFEVTANEWSAYMNIAYRYLESLSAPKRGHRSSTIHPFIDWWSHQPSRAELHRAITFPETYMDPTSVLWVEGDFIRAFNQPREHEKFDAIVSLFFIDTARNLMTYIETIHRLLKGPDLSSAKVSGKGGLWLNLGPLLYGSAPFLQLSVEEIILLSETAGFEFLETDEKWGPLTLAGSNNHSRYTARSIEAPYGYNNNALSKNAYWAQFWLAQKGAGEGGMQ
ncbi:hypothetical protein AJ80_06909 [Polytolypa hystricis UAMH7299]|uniref:Uncharacterized protein n=1 Tax=Polytolypa hystricis (strain UAMH7299) TaxID=1447883 RepID=A0A2B7XJP2_POLH7|nr:hypothetical protein AJ80_06909 [Polytolypa hystricis UAMH7299]